MDQSTKQSERQNERSSKVEPHELVGSSFWILNNKLVGEKKRGREREKKNRDFFAKKKFLTIVSFGLIIRSRRFWHLTLEKEEETQIIVFFVFMNGPGRT